LYFFLHDGTALLLPSILAPLIVIALVVVALIAVVSVVAVISVFALVCMALYLRFCITTPTDSFLTNPLMFHSL
jgi:hypothetical protein